MLRLLSIKFILNNFTVISSPYFNNTSYIFKFNHLSYLSFINYIALYSLYILLSKSFFTNFVKYQMFSYFMDKTTTSLIKL